MPCVLGTGVLKVFSERDELCVERVFPSEIFIDPLEGLYGEPRTFIQRKWMSRRVLEELFAPGTAQEGKKERARLRQVLEGLSRLSGGRGGRRQPV